MEILRVENLRKEYGRGEAQVNALDGISFSVEKGEFVAIIGPSGSGKSTLLHILGGVDRPTSGKVFVNNEDVYKRNEEQLAIFRRREVGLIYQFYNLIPVLDVVENMTLPVLMDGRKVNAERLNELLAVLKLSDRKHHLPNELSGGQQQRAGIARALILDPDVILFDEPTSALDPELVGEVLNTIKAVAQTGITMIVVTHEIAFAREVASRVVFMEGGVVVEEGKPEEILVAPKHPSTQRFLKRITNPNAE